MEVHPTEPAGSSGILFLFQFCLGAVGTAVAPIAAANLGTSLRSAVGRCEPLSAGVS